MNQKSNWQLLLGAAFLMATSAIGPGFLTQTTVFTQSLAASFGFVILISILLDIGAQLNVWRIIAVSERKAQDIANLMLPGLGYFIALLVVIGGLAFNIGNVGGAGLGINVMFGGISPESGAAISGAIAISIFLVKEAGKAMDRFTLVAGFVMVALTVYVAITSSPPVGEAVAKTFAPDKIDFAAIVTLVGGTVGGYITFAGGHRLLDAGVKGEKALGEVNKSAVSAIGIASIMRIFLFLAALGVVASGATLNPDNPPASVFQHAAGNIGYKLFGIVMWSAAVTSIIGSAYTSVSFIRTFHPKLEKYGNLLIVVFILFSTLCFVAIGNPVKILVFVGALNGMILPITLGVMLVAAYNKKIVGSYKHPLWMTIVGAIIVIGMATMGIDTFMSL
ncbi:NRAMP family divalent metal transporter [Fictibacillus sp. KU28468]|uniref:NRAMP family divalent metal transporter n=1 Tax=Fictibacillus sp. KU28468 TaxID=2991053 RepID=UPI00223CAC85|nr:NRAMP family divalent metal transporter [Fictibacillus sp. KU28468]UZJ76937.1 divalent metal cation transporter [Fictibacillus sp. KU28468]